MKYHRTSRNKRVCERLAALVRVASERQEQHDEEIPSIGFAVDEAVKQAMRRLAQDRPVFRSSHELLHVAIADTAEKLTAAIASEDLHFDLEPYFDEARKSLEGVAKEIHRLSGKLRESRVAKRVYDKERRENVEETGHLPFEIRELGLLDAIVGLLAIPVDDSGTIDIDSIRADYRVEGDWFPYEVTVKELVYVVDDDGSIFVSTENFPKELVERARHALERIAARLYS